MLFLTNIFKYNTIASIIRINIKLCKLNTVCEVNTAQAKQVTLICQVLPTIYYLPPNCESSFKSSRIPVLYNYGIK